MLSYNARWLKNLYDRAPAPAQTLLTSAYGFTHQRKVRGRYYFPYLAQLQQSQWHSFDQLQTSQNESLRRFIAYAYAHSPYWRRVFNEHAIAPDSIKSEEDLRRLPVLEKETLRASVDEIVTDDFQTKNFVSAHTSGTTGKALHLKLSVEAWQREYAFRDLHRSWGGIVPGDETATFAGHPVMPTKCMTAPFWRRNWPEHQTLFSSQHITPDTLPFYAAELIRLQPQLIHGYPSALYLVALYLNEEAIETVRPKAVYTHSETLLDYQRAAIERAFNCKVFNWYGNAELAGNIVECEAGSLHVKMEHSVVEVLRDDNTPADPGETGELVCTSFGNRATPLLRYRTGDAAVLSDKTCSCGRAGSIVEMIVGRVDDIITTPDGRRVGRLDHVFKDTLHVAEAQIVQEQIHSLRVRLVKRPGFDESELKLIEKELRLRLGDAIKLEYEFLDRIPREPNNKFRAVVSNLQGTLRL